ncbi:MAG: nucleoside 2-deoxyribosyltransferase [Candidatus Odinarchaeota archaeon]
MNLQDQYDSYICSSLRNRKVNNQICLFLENKQLTVYNPGRDTPQTGDPSVIFSANCQAIEKAKTVIAVLDYFGKDFGFEIGFVHGLNKPVIGFSTGEIEKSSVMILQAIPSIVNTLDELYRAIIQLLDQNIQVFRQ